MTRNTLQDKKALVLGATGGIGGEVARRLVERGWEVHALIRDPGKVALRDENASEDASEGASRSASGNVEGNGNGANHKGRDGLIWIRGDAMNAQDVLDAARGVSVIVHAVNPPGYRNWSQLVLPMIDNTIAAARATGARIVLPGTVYNYGPDVWPQLHEYSSQHPGTRKGKIRVEMEARLRAASRDGVRTLIVRAGDFFGPRAANNWFSQGLVKPGKPVASISYPGKPGIGHQWAYLPDVAETMVQLVEKEESLEAFASFQMKGHWDEDGRRMTRAIQQAVSGSVAPGATQAREPRVSAFPWWLIQVGGPFVPLFREMMEMRYLWREPLYMDNARLVKALGAEPHTALDDAVLTTLNGLGCLDTELSHRSAQIATRLA
jgi:nucleoside-diphosphate-sugar epimerase